MIYIRAPFTAEQVAALNRFQQHGGMHPFTCGAFHAGSRVVLIAHVDGWHCSEPSCEYRQDWAHAFMAQPEMWPKPLTSEPTTTPAPEQLLDAAYRERAHLVALLAAEYPSVITLAPDVDEPGWKLVFIDSPAGQLSWHISPRDDELFEHVERVTCDDPRAQWDGHTTAAKYARIRELTADRAQRCGRECREGHTYTGRCELAAAAPADTDLSEADLDAAVAEGQPVEVVDDAIARRILLRAARTIDGRDVDYLSHQYRLGRQSAIDDLRELAEAAIDELDDAAPINQAPADPGPLRCRSVSSRLRYLSRTVTEAVNQLPAGAPRGTLLGVAMSLSMTADHLDEQEAGR